MKTIRAEELPADLSAAEFLQSLDLTEDTVVEKNGEPRVVLTSAAALRRQREARDQLFALIDRIRARHPDADADEVLDELERDDGPERHRP